MAKPRTAWQVMPHEPPQKLSENLWWVKAKIPGVSIDRTMTLVRLSDGRLLIWSAVALDDASMQSIEAWGTPAFLIVPSALHRLDAAPYKARYPGLCVLGPDGAKKAIAEVVPLDGSLQDFPSDAHVSFRAIAGINDKEGAMLVHSSDGTTVVLNDLLFNMPLPTDFPTSLIVKMLGSAPGPRVSRAVKLLWCTDKSALRASFEQLAKIPDLVRVVVAHDTILHGTHARAALESAAQQLL